MTDRSLSNRSMNQDSGDRHPFVPLIIIASVVLFLFFPTVRFEFLAWDDQSYLVNNPYLQHLSWSSLKAVLTPGVMPEERLYIPLTYLTLIGGQPAWMVHAGNLLLHLINALLVYMICRELTIGQRPATFAAALFALHPIQIEAFVWAFSRKEVLSGALLLFAVWSYIRWLRRRQGFYLAFVIVAFIAGLLSKPTVLILPGLLLLLDYFVKKQVCLRDWLWKLPLLAVSFAAWRFTVHTDAATGLDSSLRLVFLHYLPAVINGWLERLFFLAPTQPQYLVTELYPGLISVIQWLPLLLLAAIVYLAIRSRLRVIWLGVLFAAISWLPAVAVLFSYNRMFYTADRYGYVAMAGIGMAVFGGLWQIGSKAELPKSVVVARIVFGVLVLHLAGMTGVRYARVWKNTKSLFGYAAATNPANYVALTFLGNEALTQGDPDTATAWYRRALRVKLDHLTAWTNLQIALQQLNAAPPELRRTEIAIPLVRYGAPAQAAYRRGRKRLEAGEADAAKGDFLRATRLNPRHAPAWFRLGTIAQQRHQRVAAAAAYRNALANNPRLAGAWYNLGQLLLREGAAADASRAFRQAANLQPTDPNTLFYLGISLLQSGSIEAAIEALQKSLPASPDPGAVHAALMDAYLRQNKQQKAAHHARAAIAAGRSIRRDVLDSLAPFLPHEEVP